MNVTGNTILITGGASGIGLAFAERFMKAGNKVIIVGRREEKLKDAKEKFPELIIKTIDISVTDQRVELFNWVTKEYPDINVLVNNAGIQQRVNLLEPTKPWDYYQNEFSINVDGTIHLILLFTPYFLKKDYAAFLNVSSGLSIAPGAWVPIYSATKAAIHSFTLSLRHQLEGTNVEVVEILPPAVNTDLGGVGLHTFGAPLHEFADSVFHDLKIGEREIGFGDSKSRLRASRDEIDQGVKRAWEAFIKRNPDFQKNNS